MKIRMRQLVVGAAVMGAAAAGSALAASALTPSASTGSSATQTTDTSAATQTTDTAVINVDSGSTGTTATTGTDSQLAPPDGGPGGNFDPAKGGHQFNGVTEKLLEGDTAAKVRAAAESAVSGGTVERVENDAEGNAPYEAHVVKADGSHVTVYVSADFSVKNIDTNGPGPHGQPPADGQTGSASATAQSA